MKPIILLLLCLALSPFDLLASDSAKEQRWADQIVDAILDGEAVWLKTKNKEFLGIYTEAGEDQHQAVIIMHGMGAHPDWQQVVQPLRTGLTEHGWHTLSIQMPVLANDAQYLEYAPLFEQVAPRINAAIKYLTGKGNTRIVLIGHSMGASMGTYYLSKAQQSKVDGFVSIVIDSSPKDPRMNSIKSIESIHKTPILDLYASEDRETLLSDAPKRVAAAKKAENPNYKQQVIKGANHMFDDKNDELLAAVAQWLNALKAAR